MLSCYHVAMPAHRQDGGRGCALMTRGQRHLQQNMTPSGKQLAMTQQRGSCVRVQCTGGGRGKRQQTGRAESGEQNNPLPTIRFFLLAVRARKSEHPEFKQNICNAPAAGCEARLRALACAYYFLFFTLFFTFVLFLLSVSCFPFSVILYLILLSGI